MTTGGPAHNSELVRLDCHAMATGEARERGPCPYDGVAHVEYRAINDVNLGAESVIDADGKDTVGKEVTSLGGSNGGLGEGHVATAVDHESWRS